MERHRRIDIWPNTPGLISTIMLQISLSGSLNLHQTRKWSSVTQLRNTGDLYWIFYAQRLHLFIWGYTHFIKPGSHFNRGLVLFIPEVSMCLTDQIKRTRPLRLSIHYLDLGCRGGLIRCKLICMRGQDTLQKAQGRAGYSRCIQHCPFISNSICFVLLFSFFTRTHTYTHMHTQLDTKE